MNAGKIIINEIDSRLERPFGEMLAAESKLLNTALAGELRSLKEFVLENIGTGN